MPKLDPVVKKRLYEALRDGNLDVVKECINNNSVDVNECIPADGCMEQPPLHLASKFGHLHIVRYLVEECHVDVDAKPRYDSAVRLAFDNKQLEVARYLATECHANIEETDKDGTGRYYNQTHLFRAVKKGDLESIQFLVQEWHVDVNAKLGFYGGGTVMHYVMVLCDLETCLEIMKYLTHHGHADVEMKDDHGYTVLLEAIARNQFQVAQYLIEY
jgi:ankyrin repeat protein